MSGEGGLLSINHDPFLGRSEIVGEKGTDRSRFIRGEVNKFGWVELGSSFLASEITAAVLQAQLEALPEIQKRRVQAWERYYDGLAPLASETTFQILQPGPHGSNNAHLFGLVCSNPKLCSDFLNFAKKEGVSAVRHYVPLHLSQYFTPFYSGPDLVNVTKFEGCLTRLPLFADISDAQLKKVIHVVTQFFRANS